LLSIVATVPNFDFLEVVILRENRFLNEGKRFLWSTTTIHRVFVFGLTNNIIRKGRTKLGLRMVGSDWDVGLDLYHF
jgi:hypothetical protein